MESSSEHNITLKYLSISPTFFSGIVKPVVCQSKYSLVFDKLMVGKIDIYTLNTHPIHLSMFLYKISTIILNTLGYGWLTYGHNMINKTEIVDMSTIKGGDTVMIDNKMRTVCNKDIKYCSFMGHSIFGSAFYEGYQKIKRVFICRALPGNKFVYS